MRGSRTRSSSLTVCREFAVRSLTWSWLGAGVAEVVREDVRPGHQERGGDPVGLSLCFPALGSFPTLMHNKMAELVSRVEALPFRGLTGVYEDERLVLDVQGEGIDITNL